MDSKFRSYPKEGRIMEDFRCKIANLDEMNEKWDYEIEHATTDKNNWIIWKKNNLIRFNEGKIIPYYGILNGKIITEATVALDPSIVQQAEGLVDDETVYLTAFRTIEEYQGKGYFSKLFNYMIDDLKKRGYKRATLGVEPTELKNKAIYKKYGFVNHIKNSTETYPDGTVIEVEYYSKDL